VKTPCEGRIRTVAQEQEGRVNSRISLVGPMGRGLEARGARNRWRKKELRRWKRTSGKTSTSNFLTEGRIPHETGGVIFTVLVVGQAAQLGEINEKRVVL